MSRRHDLVPLPRHKPRVGELAGGATADCAAIWCCCPCMTVNLLVLAVYKVPSAICRKAWRKQRSRMLKNKKKKMLAQKQQEDEDQEHEDEDEERNHRDNIHHHHRTTSLDEDQLDIDKLESSMRSKELTEEDIEFERQMWGQFKGTGFFRSHSQREM
ncbi:uncharacterized protein LOC124922099 [Impatiens glandulifera]|uniref:uncharacterized protein LOC124922099 n=1 Tax=Impatiens glandulifera TaxID=253017 RepID=UPI001FB083CC|nr:uncharacterized protein LOC124922099 [Impatiens glandulifera]